MEERLTKVAVRRENVFIQQFMLSLSLLDFGVDIVFLGGLMNELR